MKKGKSKTNQAATTNIHQNHDCAVFFYCLVKKLLRHKYTHMQNVYT